MSDLPLTLMTELDAVNLMLMSIGLTPVSTLTVTGLRDVSIAKLHLAHANRTVQSLGWDWNREYNYSLVPNVNGFILVPANLLSLEQADSLNYQWCMRIDPSDSVLKVYDKGAQSYVFATGANAPKYLFNITWLLDFESLPQAARNYITMRACQRFQAQSVGSQTLFQFDQAALNEALLSLKQTETRAKGANLFKYSTRYRRNRQWAV